MEITSELTPDQQARLDELRAFIGAVRTALELEAAPPDFIHRVVNRLMYGVPHGPGQRIPIGDEMTDILSHARAVAVLSSEEALQLPGVAAILRRESDSGMKYSIRVECDSHGDIAWNNLLRQFACWAADCPSLLRLDYKPGLADSWACLGGAVTVRGPSCFSRVLREGDILTLRTAALMPESSSGG